MMKKYASFILTSFLLSGPLFLLGCSDKDKPYIPPVCSSAMIVGELSEGQFEDTPTETPFSAALTNVVVKCAETSSQGEVALYTRILVKRPKTSSDAQTYKIPYFVVLSKGDTLILKEKLEADVTFSKNQRRISPLVSSLLKFPIAKNANLEDYTLYVGLQITEDQLEKNYQKRKESPLIKAAKRPLSKPRNIALSPSAP